MEHRPLRIRSPGRRWRKTGRRGVSDVVATILLLALTVTLFASIFAFVTSFPSPPAQNNNQFQASQVLTSNGANVSSIRILHLAGPAVAGTALVYLKSATQPAAAEFQSPYTVASETLTWGTVTGWNVWNLGQVWNLTFSTASGGKYLPSAVGNTTVYVVASSQLLFSVILPGTGATTPPTVVATWIAQPANPYKAQTFTVYATIAGTYSKCPTNCVELNLASVPGGTTLPNGGLEPMTQSSQGWWSYTVPTGTTTANGTYYGFVNASNTAGQATTGAVVITISNTGGATGPLISVGVVAIPQPPTAYIGNDYFAAVVTYTGSLQKAALSASFWVNQTPSYPFLGHQRTSVLLTGPTSLTISGPSTLTVYATSPSAGVFSTWLLNSSVWINATVSIAGVGTASGMNIISTPNYVQGIVFASASPSSTCRTAGTGCPSIDISVWDNWTTALGGPASLQFSGKVYANHTATNMVTGTVGSTSVSAGSSDLAINAATLRPTSSGTYVLTVVLTVVSGTTVVGYIYDTFTGTAS